MNAAAAAAAAAAASGAAGKKSTRRGKGSGEGGERGDRDRGRENESVCVHSHKSPYYYRAGLQLLGQPRCTHTSARPEDKEEEREKRRRRRERERERKRGSVRAYTDGSKRCARAAGRCWRYHWQRSLSAWGRARWVPAVRSHRYDLCRAKGAGSQNRAGCTRVRSTRSTDMAMRGRSTAEWVARSPKDSSAK